MIPLEVMDDVRKLELMVGSENMRRPYVIPSGRSSQNEVCTVESRIVGQDGKIMIIPSGKLSISYLIPEGYNFEI